MAPYPHALESRRSRGIQSFRCRVCRGIHPLRKCNRFLRLSAEKRLRAVLINKYCPNCLAHQHSGQSCRSGGRCRTCREKHHTLLHMHESRRTSRSPPRSVSPRRIRSPVQESAPSLAALLQHKSTIVMPTALVLIDNGEKRFECRALIDPCTPISRINASLAAALRLAATNVGTEKVCSATIRPVASPEQRLEVVLKLEEQLRFRTPIRALGANVRSKFTNVNLADDGFGTPSTVCVVLGADAYPRIIQPGFLPSQDGLPVAQNTIFGWVLSGSCSA